MSGDARKPKERVPNPDPVESRCLRRERPLQNLTCVYCLREFCPDLRPTKEHVIGRLFVPKNLIKSDGWNLILNACFDCNNQKSQLESEVSAITLQPEIALSLDESLVEQSHRKAAKAKSTRPGEVVAKSVERVNLKASFGAGATMSLGMVAAPQLDGKVIERLSEAHIRAFFYRVTYDQGSRRGSGLPGGRIAWMHWARCADWGNVTLLSFSQLTLPWHTRARGIGAEGYFKMAIKRQPEALPVWSFALEWNKAVRVIGFFGDHEMALQYAESLEVPSSRPLAQGWQVREEVVLPEEEDVLFTCYVDN